MHQTQSRGELAKYHCYSMWEMMMVDVRYNIIHYLVLRYGTARPEDILTRASLTQDGSYFCISC